MTYISRIDELYYFNYFEFKRINPHFISDTTLEYLQNSFLYGTEAVGTSLSNRVIDLFNLPIFLYNNLYIPIINYIDYYSE